MSLRSSCTTLTIAGILLARAALCQDLNNAPLPDIPKLMNEVMDHQKKLEKVREAYTYTSSQTVQDEDANGNVTKTETTDSEVFFVNGHAIERTVKKNGKVTVTATSAVSADGKTRTTTAVGTTPKGKKFKNVAVYDRQ